MFPPHAVHVCRSWPVVNRFWTALRHSGQTICFCVVYPVTVLLLPPPAVVGTFAHTTLHLSHATASVVGEPAVAPGAGLFPAD